MTGTTKQRKQKDALPAELSEAQEREYHAALGVIAHAYLMLSKLNRLKWKQFDNGDVSAAIEMRLYERDGKLCAVFYDQNKELQVRVGDDDQIYRDDALWVTGADSAQPLLELARRPENRGERE